MALITPLRVETTSLNTPLIVETTALNTPVTMETMALNTLVTMETRALNTPLSVLNMALNTSVIVETLTLDTPVTMETMALNTPITLENMALITPLRVETTSLNTPLIVETMALNTPVTMETRALNTPLSVSNMALNTPVIVETLTLDTHLTMETMALNTPLSVSNMALNTPVIIETLTLDTPIIVETLTLDTPLSVSNMALNTPVIIETLTIDTPVTMETMALNAPVIVETTLCTPASIPTAKEPLSRTSSTPLPLSSGCPPGHRGLRQSASYHLGVPHPGCHQSDRHGGHRGQQCPSATSRAPHWSSGSESEAEPEEEDDAHSGGGGSQSGHSVYCVVLLGDHGVGKSTLAGIFAGRADGEECGENTYERTLAVDGQETTLIVMDTWDNDKMEEEDSCMKVGSAYVIVYSITDRSSFDFASELRIQLRRTRQADKIPIILVGNKSDLVRSREVAVEEGRKCAVVFDCKFIETSASLQHNVAELFEGVVRQIRLHRNHADREERGVATGHGRRPHGKRKDSVTQKARRFLDRLVARNNQRVAAKVRSKSCHDLAVL